MQTPPPPPQVSEKAATEISGVTSVNVPVGGETEKLGASVYILSVESVSKVVKYPGVPAGGGVEPSRSEGR
jgi:hypothetical protein